MSTSAPDRKSTKERLAALQNMSPKEVRDYIASPEFEKHAGKAMVGNAKRVLTIMGSSAKQTSLDDSALLRDAISVVQRAEHASGPEAAETIAKSRAYGYDPERGQDDAPAGDDSAPVGDADDGPDDDEDEDDEDDDDGA